MYVRNSVFSLLAISLLGVASVAHADTVYSLDTSACSSGCLVLPAGTVDLKQNGKDDVLVTVTLTSDYSFRKAPDDNHHALAFDLSDVSGTVTAANISNALFTFSGAGSYKDAGLGSNFSYAFEDKIGNDGSVQTFSFDLKAAGLTETSFVSNGSFFFGVDVKGLDVAAGVGKTGNIGADGKLITSGAPPPVPEPSSIALMGTGLLACAGLMQRKKLDAIKAS